VTELIMLYVVT